MALLTIPKGYAAVINLCATPGFGGHEFHLEYQDPVGARARFVNNWAAGVDRQLSFELPASPAPKLIAFYGMFKNAPDAHTPFTTCPETAEGVYAFTYHVPGVGAVGHATVMLHR